jgi:hypothetical protein
MPDRADSGGPLRDEDMVTRGVSPAPALPDAPRVSARLSFDALARLFADCRPTLIDADLTTVDTRELGPPLRRDVP